MCSYATSDEGNLKKHIKAVHEKIKDQTCDICGFSTTDYSGLKKHIKEVHDKIKDKICSICGFTTARNAELKHHIKCIHDKIKDKICETCGYATTDNSNLRKHIKKVHNLSKVRLSYTIDNFMPKSQENSQSTNSITKKSKKRDNDSYTIVSNTPDDVKEQTKNNCKFNDHGNTAVAKELTFFHGSHVVGIVDKIETMPERR